LLLGGINCVLMVLAMVAIYSLSGDAINALREAQAKGAIKPDDVEGLFSGMLAGSAIYIIGWLLMSLTAPLVFWQKMALTKALFFSVVGVLRGIKAFVVAVIALHLMYFVGVQLVVLVLGISSLTVAAIFTLFLISLVLVHCMLYAAYKQIFGTPPALPEVIDLNKPL
jgi:phosphoglycerol transferase MdoB-like AlkP superfamily enzyme